MNGSKNKKPSASWRTAFVQQNMADYQTGLFLICNTILIKLYLYYIRR